MNYSVFFAIFALGVTGTLCERVCETGVIIKDLPTIQQWLTETNATLMKLNRDVSLASWAWATDITPEHQAEEARQNAIQADKMKQLWKESACFDCKAAKCSEEEARRVATYENIDTAALDPKSFDDYGVVQTTMNGIYSTAKVYQPKTGKSLPLDPDLSELLTKSKDYCELQWAWEGWRNETGRKMRGFYTSYVLLQNEAAKKNGYDNAKMMWTKPFWQDDEYPGSFFDQMQQAYEEVMPLYRELHAYVRGKLIERYGAAHFPGSNHIPAHLLGNMWAQDWKALYPILTPYPDAPAVDLTAILKAKGWDVNELFKQSDLFFQSIGLDKMTDEFWEKSVLIRKKGVEMVCHASAWDLYTQTDFRIKMCTEIDQTHFQTVHHEMGHISYDMQYKNQPVEFRTGANPGFHEAMGDLIALSVMTPGHFKAVDLLPPDFKEDEKTSLNALMNMALQKVAFLPFGYLIDKYRWDIFTRNTSFSDLNKAWWDLRCQMQGVSPPVPRSEEDFDAGAKHHVPASTPYDRYFFAHIAQFQFHRALCKKIGFTKNFHQCDIYQHANETAEFREAMALGQSTPWPKVLQKLTGSSKLNSSAILDYFQPLYDWLKEQNKAKGYTPGWKDACSTITRNNCNYNGNSGTILAPTTPLFITMVVLMLLKLFY